jgi:hypothetical protein
MSVQTIAGAALVKALRKAWKRDRDHRYVLNEPWVFPALTERVPDYDGKNVTIHNSVIMVHPNGICDGATGVPDKIGKSDFRPGALLHDVFYSELGAIAKAWGWPRSRVRKLADNLFYGTNRRYAKTWLAELYDEGVRKIGAPFVWIKRLLALLAFAALVAGCGGCSTPVDPFGPGEWEDPVYEEIKR